MKEFVAYAIDVTPMDDDKVMEFLATLSNTLKGVMLTWIEYAGIVIVIVGDTAIEREAFNEIVDDHDLYEKRLWVLRR